MHHLFQGPQLVSKWSSFHEVAFCCKHHLSFHLQPFNCDICIAVLAGTFYFFSLSTYSRNQCLWGIDWVHPSPWIWTKLDSKYTLLLLSHFALIQKSSWPFQNPVSTCNISHVFNIPLTWPSYSHSDSLDVEKPEAIQEHWYWNPRLSLRELGEEFRCTPPVSPAVAPVDESAAHTHASTDIIAAGTSTAQP